MKQMVTEVCPVCAISFRIRARQGRVGATYKICPNGHQTSEALLRKQRKAREAAECFADKAWS